MPRPAAQPRPQTMGVLYLDAHERGQLLSEAKRLSLDAFATQAALAIDSARLYAEQPRRRSSSASCAWRPTSRSPSCQSRAALGGHYALAAASIPCETIGGDFYDYLDLGGGRLVLTVGDVAGKGPPAALLAATVLSSFFAEASTASGPLTIMEAINRALLHRDVRARFVALFAGVLHADGRLDYCNAGHESPLIVRSAGRIDQLLLGGPVTGIMPEARYDASTTALAPGDLLVCCSDGVTEARNQDGDEYGRERLAALLAGRHGDDPSRVLDDLITSVHAFADREPQADDITALVLRYGSSATRAPSANQSDRESSDECQGAWHSR